MYVIDSTVRFPHCAHMVTHDEILAELIDRLDSKQVSGRSIASLLKVAPARITEMKNGTRRIQPHEMSVLAEFLGLGEVGKANLEGSVIWVPVIGIASAGVWREAIEMPAYLVPQIKRPNCNQAFAVQVDGDSMDQILPERSFAVVDPDQRRLLDKRVYLIRNSEGDATIKRYISDPARFEPVSNNPSHSIIYMGEHEIIVIGRVVSFTSDEGL